MIEMFEKAAEMAIAGGDQNRNFLHGAIGVRKDGATVVARNGSVYSTEIDCYYPIPEAHAEVRLLRKLGAGGTMYVARVSRKDGSFVMSRPCSICSIFIRSKRTERVFYTIDKNTYGLLYPMTGEEKTFYL